jgi:hypothetical protein
MGDADDIKKMIASATKKWTKQQKAEERNSRAVGMRRYRMTSQQEASLKQAADEIMQEAYMKASGGGKLPANARQIMYAARGYIQNKTQKPLKSNYFTQTLLPDYISRKKPFWDVAYDDRGHMTEPHTNRSIGLGTLNVRAYLRQIRDPKFTLASFKNPFVDTYGPQGCYGALLYIEKEGFMTLFRETKLAERYDIAIMSSKGVSVTAARKLAEEVCSRHGIPLLILHDFDVAGFTITRTLQEDTRRYKFTQPFEIKDLGLRLEDVEDLEDEEAAFTKSDDETVEARLERAGATPEEIEFLLERRVELNAMASDELIKFIEGKLEENDISKLIPEELALKKAYEIFAKSQKLKTLFAEAQKTVNAEVVELPEDLETKVEDILEKYPEIPWHQAVLSLIDPSVLPKRYPGDET